MAKPYQLAFTLHGHSADVRGLSAPNPELPMLLSASRDGSAIVWGPSARGNDWDAKLRVEELERRYVSCCTLVRWKGEAFLVIGSASGLLSSYALPSMTSQPPAIDAPTQEPNHTIAEHNLNLCCLDASKGGLIASGSWDKTAIIWKDFRKVVQIEGHSQAVWAIKFVGEDRVLTASADRTIVLHAIDIGAGTSHPLQTYSGHTDVVRGLSLRPDGKGFWSCGNDGLINLYTFDKAEPERTLSGHTSFVYSISAFPDGSGAVSSGEDGTLRVWSNTELVQTIAHPSMSLWSSAVVATPKGSSYYIASASADTTIRFFTTEDDLVAPITERESWNNEVSQRRLDKSQVGDVKHSDLPGMEALGRPGKKDGQVIMIKNEGKVEAYQWAAGETTWQQIGQVVDAIGSGRKQLYEGQEYDFVFDVDVAEGVPPLKLPYNTTENPWIAAQKFLERNELPTTYADQVVEFIEKNTGGIELGTGSANTFVDPYTGASRYTGGGVSAGSGAPGGDPLTGGSRYMGGGVPTTGPSYGGGSDPFTGSSAYSSQPSTPSTRVLPVKTFLSFRKINAAAAKTKLEQFNKEQSATSPDLAIDESTQLSLEEAFRIVASDKAPTTENYDPKKLIELSLRWDDAHRFPLVDVLRVLALLSEAFGAEESAPNSFLAVADWGRAWSGSKAQSTNTLLGLRGLANLFNTSTGLDSVATAVHQGLLEKLVSGRQWSELGTAKQPFATVAMNFSILAVTGQLQAASAESLLALILHIMKNETADSETVYRAAVAFGNVLSSPLKGSLPVGGVREGKQLVESRAMQLKEQRLKDLTAEIAALG